jgi:3-deoxy-D-manno-octulosonate 8-phosphate phosphatase (KDO 8-P phosphatase)
MISFEEELLNIKAFLFDVDGVLSPDVTPLDDSGDPVRTANVKDGFAIRQALSHGYVIGIITGGIQKRVKLRYQRLGVRFFYDDIKNKLDSFSDFMNQTELKAGMILYMGDDLPDLPVMTSVGIATCPRDAVPEVKAVSHYISDRQGGYGCVRDVIEHVLKAQGKWNNSVLYYNQSI